MVWLDLCPDLASNCHGFHLPIAIPCLFPIYTVCVYSLLRFFRLWSAVLWSPQYPACVDPTGQALRESIKDVMKIKQRKQLAAFARMTITKMVYMRAANGLWWLVCVWTVHKQSISSLFSALKVVRLLRLGRVARKLDHYKTGWSSYSPSTRPSWCRTTPCLTWMTSRLTCVTSQRTCWRWRHTLPGDVIAHLTTCVLPVRRHGTPTVV